MLLETSLPPVKDEASIQRDCIYQYNLKAAIPKIRKLIVVGIDSRAYEISIFYLINVGHH